MKKNFAVFFSILMLGAACNPQSPTKPTADSSFYNQNLIVGDKNLHVEIVSTSEKMALGLSGRVRMDEGQGMLFVFGSQVTPAFWMKDMKFGLDFVWMANGKVIGVTKNVPAPLPATSYANLPTYSPPTAVDKVLEVNAGWAERNRIAIGDAVKLK